VLFGRLKSGGTVRVVVVKDDSGRKKLGFVYPDGPLLPRPEKVVQEAATKTKRKRPARKKTAAKITPKPEPEVAGRSGGGKGGRGSVPKVPLKT